ncbi:MAG: nitrogen fixation protein NifQ [Pseudomonadota bacterium]
MMALTMNEAMTLDVRDLYAELKAQAAGLGNDEPLARMLASQRAGIGAMPLCLGLSHKQFTAMMRLHFPGAVAEHWMGGAEFDLARAPELAELRTLFLAHCPKVAPEKEWMAEILAAGCLGSDHLWQDLGLWSRQDLSGLIEHNFPALKAKNDRDMKWKRFFYKQLCVQEGVYTCRSPSCEVCDDYVRCFGPEE